FELGSTVVETESRKKPQSPAEYNVRPNCLIAQFLRNSPAGAVTLQLPIFIRRANQQTPCVRDPVDPRFLPRLPAGRKPLINKHRFEIAYFDRGLAIDVSAAGFVRKEREEQAELAG